MRLVWAEQSPWFPDRPLHPLPSISWDSDLFEEELSLTQLPLSAPPCPGASLGRPPRRPGEQCKCPTHPFPWTGLLEVKKRVRGKRSTGDPCGLLSVDDPFVSFQPRPHASLYPWETCRFLPDSHEVRAVIRLCHAPASNDAAVRALAKGPSKPIDQLLVTGHPRKVRRKTGRRQNAANPKLPHASSSWTRCA